MKTAVIYARYSSDSQTEQSIEGQIRVCRQYANDNNLFIVDTYIDRAMTGTNDNRADFQRMMKDSAKGQWQFIIVYKLDRFSRNKYESVIHKKTLKDNGVKLVSAMEKIPDTPEGALMEALLEGFNQYYSEELAQKVNRGITESWLKGNSTGGYRPYGYNVVDKKYLINEPEAEVVKRIFTMYSQGYTVVTIKDELARCGIRRDNGEFLTTRAIYKMLHDIKYTGKVSRRDVVYDKIYPQIVSDDVWLKVCAINEENKHAPSRKKEVHNYFLSGKLKCGQCGRNVIGVSGTSRTGDVYQYYVCSSQRKERKKPCNLKTVNKQQLEDLVINITTSILNTNDNISKIAKEMFNIHQKATASNATLKSLTKRRAEALKASKNIIVAIEQGIITEQTKARLVELENQISLLDFEIAQEQQRSYTNVTVEDIEQFLKSKIFTNTNDLQVRKLIINTFIREIIYYNDKIIITYNFTDDNEPVNPTDKHRKEVEKQSETAVFSSFYVSPIFSSAPPNNGTDKVCAVIWWEKDWKEARHNSVVRARRKTHGRQQVIYARCRPC